MLEAGRFCLFVSSTEKFQPAAAAVSRKKLKHGITRQPQKVSCKKTRFSLSVNALLKPWATNQSNTISHNSDKKNGQI